MATLAEGARAIVQGSGSNRYTLEHKGDVYSCTCPAWRNQNVRIEQRTCKHLRKHLGDAVETARIGAAATTPRDDRIRARRVTRFIEDRERRAERFAALERTIEQTPVLDDRMQTVYGLRLPRHLAYSIGWWLALSPEEKKEAWSYVGTGPVGIGEWYEDGAIDRRVTPGLDERLQFRFRSDPPEMVSIFCGNSDGGHWGLWYDDPNELPITIVHNFARDSAETYPRKRTFLESIREDVAGREDESSFDPAEYPHRTAILDWLDVVLERELEAYADQAPKWLGSHPDLLGGMGSIGAAWEPTPELTGYEQIDERLAAYKAKDPVVERWIAIAKKELDAGSAARALFLGRELHWLDAEAYRPSCTELLVRAYEKLGRNALAEIVKVHHLHRDLGSVDVYESASSAFGEAAYGTDVEAMRAVLASHTPTKAELGRAIAVATSTPVLDLLLAVPNASAVADDAVLSHLDDAKESDRAEAYPELRDRGDLHRAAVGRIFETLGARGKAFATALEAEPAIRDKAIAHADLAWRSLRGRTVLHVAAAVPSLDGVRGLLDRGIDPQIKDLDGETAFDRTRSAREKSPRVASDVFTLLDERGGGPPREVVEQIPEWTTGTIVTHKQFGEGVVEAVAGIGDQTKLTIKFKAATKVLISKFVTRA